jgi:hypothetical protein
MEQFEITFEDLATFSCSHCFEENEVVVDPSEGLHQIFIEDCWVCCYPNVVHVDIDVEARRATAYAETE